MANETSAPGGATAAPLPAPPGERVQAASAEASTRLSAANAPGKGRGRPATPGSPHSQFKANGAKLAAGEKPAGAGSGVPAFRPGVVERAVHSMLSVCDRTVQRRVHSTALILTKSKELANEFAAEVEMSEEERRDIAALAEAVCLQYSLMGQHAPAVLLATHLTFYGGRVALTMHQLNQIAEFNRAQANKAAPAPEAKAT